MELSFWGACGIVGVGKSDKVITGGKARRYRSDANKKSAVKKTADQLAEKVCF
jgi:hypothetical protein